MRKKTALAALAVLGFLLACGGSALAEGGKPRLAVVALGVNDWANSMSASGGTYAGTFIDGAMTDLLARSEKAFSADFQVKPAESFASDPAFLALSIGKLKDGLYGPIIQGKNLPSFSEDKKEVIRGALKDGVAEKLCALLGVDRVVLIYTEWTVATGGFVPISRALAKNCVAVYSSDGKLRFFDRKDVQGSRAIGGMGRVVLNAETIGYWVEAFERGLLDILKENRKKML